jgi:hypothetical protein
MPLFRLRYGARPKSCGLYRAIEIACTFGRIVAGVPGGLAAYPAAHRVEFRGQPGRSCGPWWRSSCRLWPRPSTWSRGRACLVDGTITPCWSYAEHDELWSRKHGTTGSTPNWSACSTAPPSTSLTRCQDAPAMRKAFTTTPVAEIVAHSGGGNLDKGAGHQRWRRDLLCAATERGTLRTRLSAATHARPTLARWRGDRGHRWAERNNAGSTRGGRRRPVGATQGRSVRLRPLQGT